MKVTYDWLNRKTTSTDQRGVVHAYSYDAVGRLIVDAVTSLGRAEENVDGSVRRIEYAYQDDGKLLTVTSFDAAVGGAVVNQIKYTYDGWGQLKSRGNRMRAW